MTFFDFVTLCATDSCNTRHLSHQLEKTGALTKKNLYEGNGQNPVERKIE